MTACYNEEHSNGYVSYLITCQHQSFINLFS